MSLTSLRPAPPKPLRLGEITSRTPFPATLEYSAPARGGWTIVHTGLLLPESHEIFVCAACCLRGVVLSAAELHDEKRFSTITVDEASMIHGGCEDEIIAGVTEILRTLPQRPRAVEVFTSCVHHFLNTDIPYVFSALSAAFPDIDFIRCWMNPTMRKTRMPPDPYMRMQLYAPLGRSAKNPRRINLIGNNLPQAAGNEMPAYIRAAGFTLLDICDMHRYDEYRQMETSFLNIITNPAARPAAQDLEKRLGQSYLYLPVCFDPDGIEENLRTLSQALEVPAPDWQRERAALADALAATRTALGGMRIAIDTLATGRPLGLARLLWENGMNVDTLYLDAISDEEADDFTALQALAPQIKLFPTVHPGMAFADRTQPDRDSILAVGQKAAYFTGTTHYVNIVEDGGLHGFGGIISLLAQMREAAQLTRDAQAEIQVKGWGCCC